VTSTPVQPVFVQSAIPARLSLCAAEPQIPFFNQNVDPPKEKSRTHMEYQDCRNQNYQSCEDSQVRMVEVKFLAPRLLISRTAIRLSRSQRALVPQFEKTTFPLALLRRINQKPRRCSRLNELKKAIVEKKRKVVKHSFDFYEVIPLVLHCQDFMPEPSSRHI
jgi:hypothetical protein